MFRINDHSHLRGAKALITGGLGLIGSKIARRLVDLGTDVLLVDSLNENFGGNLFNIEEFRDRLRVNISDVRDTHGLRYLLRECDIIFNLAGQTSHMDSMKAPFEDLEINCAAQLSLLEACRQINPGVRVIFASTRQVYGRPEYLPVDERHPVRPVDVNGINKLAGESYHTLYHDFYGLQTTVLRLTNTYGPGMRIKDARQIFLGLWVRNLLEGRPIEVWGGEQVRDFTFVEDAAEAFLAAALAPGTIGRICNVGGFEAVSISELARLLVGENGGGTVETKDFPRDRKLIDIGNYRTDDRMFRALTGWSPKVSLASGLTQTLNFYRANADRYT